MNCLALLIWPVVAALGAVPGTSVPAVDDRAFDVTPGAIPVHALLQSEKTRHAYAVVVVPSDGYEQLAHVLERRTATALKRHRLVQVARRWGRPQEVQGLADEEVARLVQLRDHVDRVVLVRLYPGLMPAAPPRPVFVLLDGQGTVLMTQASRSVVVPRQRDVSKGVVSVMEDAEVPGAHSPVISEFRRRALSLRRTSPLEEEESGLTYVVVRGNEELTDDELEAMGAPRRDEARVSWRPERVNTSLMAAEVLPLLLAPVLPPTCGLGGVGCGSMVAMASFLGVGGFQAMTEPAYISLLYGFGCLVVGGGGLLGGAAGMLVSLVCGAVSGGLILRDFFNTTEVHPYEAFVRQYNLHLCRELGLQPHLLPARYFP